MATDCFMGWLTMVPGLRVTVHTCSFQPFSGLLRIPRDPSKAGMFYDFFDVPKLGSRVKIMPQEHWS